MEPMTVAALGLSELEPLLGLLDIELLGRLLLATLLGGAIGLEREISGKPAGLRTNILICFGATLLTEVSIAATSFPGSESGISDPGRIAAQIVSGIGFLGAGTIIQARGSVTGLTTAATLWVVAALGMAVGGRMYVAAVGGTLLVLLVLLPLGKVEFRIAGMRRGRIVRLGVDGDRRLLEPAMQLLDAAGLRAEIVGMEREGRGLKIRIEVHGEEAVFRRACGELMQLSGIGSLEVER